MASIYKAKNGRWVGQLVVGYYSAGKARHKVVSGRTKAEAKAKLDALEQKVKAGVGKSTLTVGDLFNRWMDNYCKTDLKPTTWESYEVHVRLHLKPLAPLKLQDLTKLNILEWKTAEVKKGARSLRSIAYSLSILKGALSKGEEWNLIETNPAMKIRVGNIPEFESKPFTLEEARAFLDAIKEDRLAALYTLALGTGLRQGECLALRWSDLDLDRGTVSVKHTLARTQEHGLVLQSPKTRKSKREVYLPPFVIESLREHRRFQDQEREGRSHWDKRDFVFTTKFGDALDGSNVSGYFVATLKEHGLRRIRFHDLRHCAASLALQAGSDMKTVSEQLGHSAIGITLNLYSHVSEQARQQIASNMQNLVKSA